MLLSGSLYSDPVLAQSSRANVGVVFSRENAAQWTQITDRLSAIALDYCILDTREWQNPQDLNSVKVLFLPNVSNINNAQAQSLQRWVNSGGKVIASGPTGESSTQEVKSTLRNIFGAYWSFPTTRPSNLILADQQLRNQSNLSGTLMGGVVIPTDQRTRTTASWSYNNANPPAVVANDKSTFLGWRWGLDHIANADFDNAWLRNTLGRYGIQGTNNPSQIRPPQPCNVSNNNLSSANPPTQTATNIRQTVVNPPSPPPNQIASANIPNQQLDQMIRELDQLIHRVENTLIKADAQGEKYDLPMTEVVKQIQQDQTKTVNPTNPQNSFRHGNAFAHNAVLEGKRVLQDFPQLASQDFNQARQNWLNARRRLWDNYPTDRHFAQSEVRAMWLDRGTIVKAKSKADLAPLFDRMAEAGINTIFFETVNASYPIYPSKVAPEQNPMTRGWDPLQASIELAHERGMELHAWAWIFAGANQGHNRLLNQPENYLGPVLSRNPSWVLKDQNGQAFNRTPGFQKAFLDPANPQARQYLHNLLEEIAKNYDVDGIQLDYIRYPFQDRITRQHFGYTDISRRMFKDRYGVDPQELTPSSPLWSQWSSFRISLVDSFVKDSSARLKAIRPDLVVSAAVFPMERRERLNVLQQNWEEWINNQSVDMMVLMTYALDTGSFESRIRSVKDYSLNSSSLIIPGIRLLNVPYAEALDQIQLLRNMPTTGFALFAAENFNSNLENILIQTQGNGNGNGNLLPHRQSFKAASQRYQALQKEWNFLLLNNQVVIAPNHLQEWASNADSLNERLEQLAQNPSQRNLLLAKNSLSRFRNRFSVYLKEHRNLKPLQVESWENRLMTLENLLNYGERQTLANN